MTNPEAQRTLRPTGPRPLPVPDCGKDDADGDPERAEAGRGQSTLQRFHLLDPVVQFVLAGVLLTLAQRRGNLTNRAKAWQLQCGMTIGEDPTLASDSSKDGGSGLARAEDCVRASQQANQAGSQ